MKLIEVSGGDTFAVATLIRDVPKEEEDNFVHSAFTICLLFFFNLSF